MINIKYIIFCLFTNIVLFAQYNGKKIDSLWVVINSSKNDTIKVNTYNEINLYYTSTNTKKADSISKLILQLSKKNNYQKGLGYYYFNSGNTMKSKGNLNKALSNFIISKYYFNKLKNKSLYLDCVYVTAFCYMDMNTPDLGKEIVDRALKDIKLSKKNEYNKQLSRLNYFLGVYHSNVIKDDYKSISFFIKSNYYAKKADDYRAMYNCYNQIILLYFEQENWEKALYYSLLSEKCLNIFESKAGIPDEFYRCNNLSFLSKSNHYLKRYLTSLSQSEKALAIGEKIKDNPTINFNLTLIALNHYYLGNYNLSIGHAKKLITKYPEGAFIGNYIIGKCQYKLHNYKKSIDLLASNIKKYEQLVSTDEFLGPYYIFKDISDVYSALKDYKSSNYFLNLYTNNKIKLLETENKNSKIKLAELFNSKNLEFENKQLHTSKKEKELELKIQKNKSYLSRIIIFFILFILSILLFILLKIKKVNTLLYNSKTEIENSKELLKIALIKKNVLLKEIHHRVKNNLQLIISLQNIMVRRNKLGSVSDFLLAGHSRINAMALIHESLYQNENIENVDIRKYINQLITHIQNIEKNSKVTINVFIDAMHFSLDTALPLGLIINELITNSYKHAFPKNTEGMINISIQKNVLENNYLLRYSDTGIPYGNEIIKKEKFGLELVHLLIKQLKGELVSFTKEKKEYLINFKNVNIISDTK